MKSSHEHPGWRERVLSDARARVGTTIDGKYRIVRIVGLGGMGVVYDAVHLFVGRHVALKLLHPTHQDRLSASERFLREAGLLGRLRHRAIVEVLDGGFVDGTTPYIVMELLAGENVRQRIARGALLSEVELRVFLRELLIGIDAAHRARVVHCDLKPENVYLIDKRVQERAIVLLDFGLAHVLTSVGALPRPVVYGTVDYMPAEQLGGEVLDERTDLFSLGVVAFEAVTGTLPFPPRSSSRRKLEWFRRNAQFRVDVPEGMSGELAQLLADLLSVDRRDRPASAALALDRLR